MNPLQRAATRRKLWYLGAILGLFTLSMFWRGTVDVPLAGRVALADRLAARTIKAQATKYELRELEQGDPEVLGTLAGRGLVGSRGLMVSLLWYNAIEQQKRNDFHKFEQLVKAVTTLQPHFITPWIFQSWNIAYNVSVEMQSLGDMYHYIARGIELLSEGEKRNRKSPDMRYQIGFYYQNKFGVSDQVQTLRCLFDLSNIPPPERKASNLTNADGSVNLAEFQKFCEKNPLLVRRLRGEERRERDRKGVQSYELLRTRTPAEVVDFLKTNYKVPARYTEAGEFLPKDRMFPVLPERFNEGPDESHPLSDRDPGFTAFLTARAWFTWANTLVPPNPRDAEGNPVPAGIPRPGTGPNEFDPRVYRMPRLPMLILFRQGPSRAQTYQAEMLQKDGWFDADGWEVDARVDDANAWFTEPGPGPARTRVVKVGTGREWSREAWEKAARLWQALGEGTGQLIDEARLQRYRAEARIPPGGNEFVSMPPEMSPEQAADEAFARRHAATSALYFYHQNRSVTNYPYYLASAQAEARRETVAARKALWLADQSRRTGAGLAAIKQYAEGLALWKGVLLANPAFHRSERLDRTEEQTYEYELEYLRLLALRDDNVHAKARELYAAAFGGALPFLAAPPPFPATPPDGMYLRVADAYFSVFGGEMPANLTDGRAGTPWVRPDVKQTVLSQQGVVIAPGAGGGAPPAPEAQPQAVPGR